MCVSVIRDSNDEHIGFVSLTVGMVLVDRSRILQLGHNVTLGQIVRYGNSFEITNRVLSPDQDLRVYYSRAILCHYPPLPGPDHEREIRFGAAREFKRGEMYGRQCPVAIEEVLHAIKSYAKQCPAFAAGYEFGISERLARKKAVESLATWPISAHIEGLSVAFSQD